MVERLKSLFGEAFMRAANVFLVCLVPFATMACGSSLSGSSEDGGGKDSGPPTDGTIRVEASEPDGTTPRPEGGPQDGTTDTISTTEGGEPEASTCLAESPDTATGLFVLPGGSTTSTCGSITSPCGTIDAALTVAAVNSSIMTLYVGPGTYTETATVVLQNGLAIVGGWNVLHGTWTHNCVAPEIDGPSPVFSASGLTSSTTLDTLDIVEKAAAASGGGSVYGITSSASTLVLSNITVKVALGGAGTMGGVGSTGTTGTTGGCSTPSDGVAGSIGSSGTATSAGTFSAPPAGFAPASNGTTGGTGGTGDDGTAGGAGAIETNDTGCTQSGGSCTATGTSTVQGDPGIAGCPGGGGSGGTPGSGGGCSIAVYAYGGSVTITGGSLVTAGGGVGGNGGGGGPGGLGAAGVVGTSVPYTSGCGYMALPSPHCTLIGSDAAGGAAGGTGGAGGVGGQGGGGAGGCSYGYYADSPSTVTATGVTYHVSGGGTGGTPNGAKGPSGDHN
jgi:hypothetical protein